MTAFNRQETKEKAIQVKIRRAIIQSKCGHPDIKLKHPDWIRDAVKQNYTMIKKTITENTAKKQIRNEKYRSKLHEIK